MICEIWSPRLGYSWTGVQDVIIYSQDRQGDENTMLFKKNISEVRFPSTEASYSYLPHADVVMSVFLHENTSRWFLWFQAALELDRQKRTVISNRPGVKAVILGNNNRDSRILVGLNDENPA